VRAHEIDLQLAHLFGGDANRGEFPEASVDTVGGFVRGDQAIDNGAGRFHAGHCGG